MFYHETTPLFLWTSCSPIDCQSGGVGFTMKHLHFVVDQPFRLLTTNWEAYFLPCKASIVSVDQLFPYWLASKRCSFYKATLPLIYGSTDRWLILFFQHLNRCKPYRPVFCKGSVHKFTNNSTYTCITVWPRFIQLFQLLTAIWEALFLPCNTSIISADQQFHLLIANWEE